MKQLVIVVVASVALALAGCSKAADSPVPSGPTTSASSVPTTSSPTTSETTSAGATATGTTVAVDQSTPEAAITSWLNAMLAGDKETVCALMASGGKAIADVPDAVQACSGMIGSMLDTLRPLADAFRGLTIEGATVTGETATFESVTTKPPTAAQIVKSFKAVRLNGKWYITQR